MDMRKAEALGRVEHYSRRVAELAKILSKDDASRLILAFSQMPEEVLDDIRFIERAAAMEWYDSIHDLLTWYHSRMLFTAADITPNGVNLAPKKELRIFKRSAAS